jgi:hypothetical protein
MLRLERNQDKETAKATKTMKVAMYDLQAVLAVPRGDVSVFYYQSKLNSYNFTICELNSQVVVRCTWYNENGSCVWKYRRRQILSTMMI